MDVPNRVEPPKPPPEVRFSDGLSHTKATALVMLCVVLGLALLVIVALVIVQWIDNPGSDLPSEARTERTVPAAPVDPTSVQPQSENSAAWITQDDYPAESLRNNEQGTVRIGWTVDPSGRVGRCDVTSTSGYPRLDAAACDAVERNGRYPDIRPPADARHFERRVVWRIPTQ